MKAYFTLLAIFAVFNSCTAEYIIDGGAIGYTTSCNEPQSVYLYINSAHRTVSVPSLVSQAQFSKQLRMSCAEPLVDSFTSCKDIKCRNKQNADEKECLHRIHRSLHTARNSTLHRYFACVRASLWDVDPKLGDEILNFRNYGFKSSLEARKAIDRNFCLRLVAVSGTSFTVRLGNTPRPMPDKFHETRFVCFDTASREMAILVLEDDE
jgi:hypothetical protein